MKELTNISDKTLACDQIKYNLHFSCSLQLSVSYLKYWKQLTFQATDSTDWASIPREGLKAACMKELVYNDTLKNEIEDGVPIAQKIKAVNCPLECSGNGKCINGKSKNTSGTVVFKVV